MLLRSVLISSLMFAPLQGFAQVQVGDRTYTADQNQVNQSTQGYTDQTTQAVGDSQVSNNINTGTQSANIHGGGSGLGKSLILAGGGSVAAAMLLTKVGVKKTTEATADVAKGTQLSSNIATASAAPPFYKKAAFGYAVAGGMMALAMLASRQGKANYDAADQAFQTAATSSWCGQVECPNYNPNYPTPGDVNFPEYPGYSPGTNPPGGNPNYPGDSGAGMGGGTNPDGSYAGGGTSGGGLDPQSLANVRAMIAKEKAKASALISELEKQGYKLSPDGKTLTTPKGTISADSMSSPEGMKQAGFSDEAIKEIEAELKKANEAAAKGLAEKEAQLDAMIGDEGGDAGRTANMDPTMPGFDPSKYLKGLNLNGDPAGGARAPAGLAVQLSSGESIGAKNDNIFAMVQRAYKIQQRTGKLGNLREPAGAQRTGAAPLRPGGF